MLKKYNQRIWLLFVYKPNFKTSHNTLLHWENILEKIFIATKYYVPKNTDRNQLNHYNSKCCKYLNTFSFLIPLHLTTADSENKWLSMDQIFCVE